MKIRTIILVFIFQFYTTVEETAVYNKITLTDPAALCLDGSPGSYYISNGTNPNKFLLHF